ncbi:uncharacterized protein Bfra_009772 [Botrytis fragariae]|uniref:Uncharacterized protein n=1 Tax=Botrytis fragariae TaxID=1964551 RepID=A0A8H6AMN0_9HELO|nr:uncharacterized protein Bfra_009772 [Botrytis fragariae]KAF5870386.1 hypothetical protein Bfra_009772 [Botrytis fragariae]
MMQKKKKRSLKKKKYQPKKPRKSRSFENFIAETLAFGIDAVVPLARCGVVDDADGAAAVGFEIDFSVEGGLVVVLICETRHVLDR